MQKLQPLIFMRQGRIAHIAETERVRRLARKVARRHKQVRFAEDKNERINWQYGAECVLNDIRNKTTKYAVCISY